MLVNLKNLDFEMNDSAENEEVKDAQESIIKDNMEGVNTASDNYAHNDGEDNYNEGIKDSFCASVDYISEYVDKGTKIGTDLLGIPENEPEIMYLLENLIKEKWLNIYNGTEEVIEGYNIDRHRPLKNSYVQFALFSDNSNKMANTFKPDVLTDYQKYDIILVDEEYAKGMNENKGSLPKDYLDRLYIIKSESDNADGIKNKSFLKVFDAKTPGEYMNDILTGRNPSVYSIQNLLDTFAFANPTLIYRYQMISLRNMLPAYIEERKRLVFGYDFKRE